MVRESELKILSISELSSVTQGLKTEGKCQNKGDDFLTQKIMPISLTLQFARNLVLLMWASSKTGFSHVAVRTKNLKSLRIAHMPYLSIKAMATYSFASTKGAAMLVSPTINVVYRKKFYIALTTTSTNTSIVGNYLQANSLPKFLFSCSNLIRIFLRPFLKAFPSTLSYINRKSVIVTLRIFSTISAISSFKVRRIFATTGT